MYYFFIRAIVINNCISCTLGHNIIENDVIKHPFFGTDVVINDLKKIKGFNEGYITLNMEDFIRDNDTGKVINIIKK